MGRAGVTISVHNLHLRPEIRRELRRGTAALISRPLTLNIGCGKFILVSGNNGIGKSTFLRYLAGLEVTSPGQVLWDDRATPPRPMSYLCQQYSQTLFHWHSAARNLDLVLDSAGELSKRRNKFLDALSEFLGEDTTSRTPLGLLSGGQQHIAAIVIALAAPGPLVILDEPFSGLTWTNATLMAKFIKGNSAGRTVVMASHASQDEFETELGVAPDSELNLTQLAEGSS